MILIPASHGELADKITILRIKRDRIGDNAKRANVERELSLLEDIAAREAAGFGPVEPLLAELTAINAKLWDIEDAKRAAERAQRFDGDFIAMARAVYLENDRRAAIKRQINDAFGSDIVEEKSHHGL